MRSLVLFAAFVAVLASPPKPNILVVMVDDLGWGDTGYHRTDNSPEIVTPAIDALVGEGIETLNHRVHQMCTPTRAAFQSGRLPVHVQLTLDSPCSLNNGIPPNMTTIATKLKKAGYATHLIGKWDAGMPYAVQTPAGRGYDTSLNYFSHGNWAWTEAEWQGSYHDNTGGIPECNPPTCFKDLWDTNGPAIHLNGTLHEEYLFRQRMLSILDSHDPSKPLFMVYTPKLCHYPLQAPQEYQDKFSFIKEDHRRTYAAMVNFLDDQVANLTETFKAKGLWDNTLMVFTTDNGGYVKSFEGDCNDATPHGTACFNGEAGASNYPLRGGKYSHFEGGVLGNSFISGGLLPSKVRGTQLKGLMHVADWYATFAGLAGVDTSDPVAAAAGLPPVDSLDMWPLVSGENMTSPRTTVLYDDTTFQSGKYKLMTGKQIEASWGGPQYPNATTATDPIALYNLDCTTPCLFDVEADPTEHTDIAADNPDIVAAMMKEMQEQVATIYHPPKFPNTNDKCADVAMNKWSGFLGPFMD